MRRVSWRLMPFLMLAYLLCYIDRINLGFASLQMNKAVGLASTIVGVLFGEHRQRHTFDDQLALAARAAGMALERILKARRS